MSHSSTWTSNYPDHGMNNYDYGIWLVDSSFQFLPISIVFFASALCTLDSDLPLVQLWTFAKPWRDPDAKTKRQWGEIFQIWSVSGLLTQQSRLGNTTRRLSTLHTSSNTYLFHKPQKFSSSRASSRTQPATLVMSTAYPIPTDISPATVKNTASLLRIVALGLISGAAIASRLFAVINFESIIHELYVVHVISCFSIV